MESDTSVVGFRRVGAPFAVGVLAVLGTLPVVTAVEPPPPAPQWLVVVGAIVAGVVGVGLAAAVGSILAPDVGLRTLAPERLPGDGVRAYRLPAAVGVAVAVVTLGLHAAVVALGGNPGSLTLWETDGPLAVVGSVAGGVLAELLLRFGVMTGVVWTVWTYRPALDRGVTRAAVWVGIVAAAALGGVATLPMRVVDGVEPGVVGVVFTVGGGVVFGLLYWRYDLAAAAAAHAVASFLRAAVTLV
jgi:hypothetical protein